MENAQSAAVILAYIAGQAVEFRTIGFENWFDLPPNFNLWNFEESEYRVKPLAHDTFDWSAASHGFKWLARDLNGEAFLYVAKPHMEVSRWGASPSARVSAMHFSSYSPGPRDWKDSLQERPE